jgi:integrase
VFTTSSGTPLDNTNVTKRFQKALHRAALPHMRFHDLRRSAGSLLIARGVHARVIMDMLGHSSFRLTMDTYASVMFDLKREAAEQMGELLKDAAS